MQDHGPGIPPDQRERIFDRFYRTDAARDRASGGTGLGLAIVRAIVEAHGGRVQASVGVGGGAHIDLELPRFTPFTSDTAAGPSRARATIHTPGRLCPLASPLRGSLSS